jgi:hypothetical protein
MFIGIAFAFRSGLSSGNADWVVFEGVAGNDYYDGRQYSYRINQWAYENQIYSALNPANWWFNANKSLRIGMTEYGEFATPGGVNAGIAYGVNSTEWQQTESWASIDVNPALYIQGWVFYMNYTRAAVNRAIEAYAIFSDTATAESARKVYSWDGAYNPSSSGSGIVTAGSLAVSGVQVLYDSARLAVGRTTVVIRDGFYNEDVAKVTFTVIFQKDTKYAIIFKDVKILIDQKVLDLIKDLSFGERYEIDLARGINPSNQAYIHYFDSFSSTVYQHPLTGDTEYDVVQAFNPNRNYTYFAGYWPNATEYAVYSPLVPNVPGGFTRLLSPGTAIADIPVPPAGPGEASTPWVIAQWRYNSTLWPKMLNFLAKAPNREIRFVEVAGMTDYNKGQAAAARALDFNAGDGTDYVDVEIQFLLDNVFNPEDLTSAGDAPPFQWLGVGQASAAVDSAGAAFLPDMPQYALQEPMPFFDKADTFKGTIPYGLTTGGNFPSYLETFSNSGKGTGTDTTTFYRTGLLGFAFNFYDGTTGRTPPQPVAGGRSYVSGFWYPSKDPLTQRWSSTNYVSFTGPTAYDTVTYNPNGIMTVGGPKANWLSRYFNDFNFAIDREGTSAFALANGGIVTGSAPTSNPSVGTYDFYPLTSWKTGASTFGYDAGYAVIALARDINGTRGLSVYGWDGRDTYWASAWTSQYLGQFNAWVPPGTVAMLLKITYSTTDREPTAFTIVKALGKITEFGYNLFTDPTAWAGYDTAAATTWNGYIVSNTVSPTLLPATGEGGRVWWYEKIPTTSIALVDFDP